MRRWSWFSRFTAITLVALLPGFVAPVQAASRDGGLRPSEPADGETLFTGLYFGRGEAAKYFPEIWENPQILRILKDVDLNKSIDAQNRIMDLLREQDETTFTRFATEMQSGNQIRVRNAMREVGERLRLIASEQMQADDGGKHRNDIRGQCDVLALVAAVAIVAVVVVAGALWVYLYVDYWGPGLDKPKSADGSQLQQDFCIDTLTHRLATRAVN